MTNVIPLASRRAAPPVPCLHTSAHQATSTPQANELHLIQLHAAAFNGLHAALHHLRDPRAAEATMWAQAIARTQRALTAMKRASSASRQTVEG